MPSLKRQRQADLCEFVASPIYIKVLGRTGPCKHLSQKRKVVTQHPWLLFLQTASSETTMEEELGLVGGATADDTEAELIRSICEKELLDGKKDRYVPSPS
jgi:hypothetical protein